MRSRTLVRFCVAALGLAAAHVSAQTLLTWSTATSGQWTTSSNWSPTIVPNSLTLYDALISATGSAYTVTASGSSSLSVRKLDVTSANATVLFNFSSTGVILSLGSATSTFSAGLVEFQTGNGFFGNGAGLTTLNIGSGAELLFSTSANTRNLNSLTLGNAGTLHATSGVLSIGGGTALTNQSGGLVHADGAEIAFQNGTTLSNSGTLRATGAAGILRFNNSLTTANLGTVDLVSGGHAYLASTLTNTSATLNAPGAGSYELLGGTIVGGTIASGALTFTTSGGTLNNVSYTGAVTLPANAYVYFTGGTNFTGSTATFGNNSGLYWQQTGTLASKALTFNPGSYLYVYNTNSTLTLDSASTATGQVQIYSDGSSGTAITNQGNLTHTSGNTGNLYAKTFSNTGSITNTSTNGSLFIGSTSSGYNTTNTGSITVNGSGAIIYLDGNFDNTGGTLTATNGSFSFRGNNTTAHLNGGTLDIASGAHAYLNGTLDNTSATLNAPHSGTYELAGGTINSGAIASGALTFTGSGGVLNNVSYTSAVTLPANASVYFKGGTSFTGSTATFGNNSGLYWQQTGTLASKALTFNPGSYLYVYNTNSTLTLDSATTATGQVQIYTDGSSGTAITNQANLTHTSSNTGYLYGLSFANTGTISNTSSNGSLVVGNTSSGYNTTNAGTIIVNGTGANIYLDGNFDNTGGTLTATTGQFIFRGNNTTTHLNSGTLDIASGAHAYLNGTLDNTSATLNAPHSGQYELYGGTINNGTIAAGALSFTSNSGTLNNVSYTGAVTLPANASVYFKGGTSFTGSTATFGTNSGLYWQQTGTLTSKALTFNPGSYIDVSNTNSTLTLDSASTATGQVQIYTDGSSGTAITNQGNLTHTSSNTGYLYGISFANTGTISNTSSNGSLIVGNTNSGYNTTNTGTITVNGANANLYLDGNFDNTGGTLTATAGQFIFRGNNTTAHLNGGTLDVASGAHAYLNGTLDNTSATLNAPHSGQYELYNGTINNGTIAANALSFTNNGGTLNNVIYTGALTLPANTYVYFKGGTSFTGGTATLGTNSGLYWQQTGTLASKALTFGAGSYIDVSNTNSTLTLDSATTATGQVQIYTDGSSGTSITNQGNLTHTSASTGYLYGLSFANMGTISNTSTNGSLVVGSTSSGYNTTNTGNITVNGSGANIYLDGNFDNSGGTLNATSGALIFRGNNTTAHLNGGTLNVTGGHAYLNGTLNNASATLNVPATGQYELYNGTITGGAIATGALTFTSSGGTLNGVSLTGALNLPTNSYVNFTGGTSLTGGTMTFGTNSSLYWQQTGTLVNKALTFGAGSYLYVNGVNSTLTLDSATTATGQLQIYSDGSNGTAITNQGNLTHTSSNVGYLNARTFANTGTIANTGANSSVYLGSTSSSYTTTNTGNITVNASNANIYLDGNFDNTGGTLTATNGALIFRSANTTAHLNGGTLDIASGAHAYLNGTLDNSSTTLNAPHSGQYELYNGTINNGTVASGALTFTTSGGTLNGVTLLGSLNFPTNTYAYFANSTTVASNATLTLGTNAGLYWQQAGQLTSDTLTFGTNSLFYLTGVNSALTLDANTTATGQLQIYSDGSTGTALTNQGNLTHNSTNTGYLYARTFTNSGTITTTAGSLNLGLASTGYTFTNASGATVRVNGGNVFLHAPSGGQVQNFGTFDVQSGTLYTGNFLTNGAGSLLSGAGTINGNVAIAGGTVAPGNTGIGALTFASGTLAVTNPATFSVEIGGATADKLVFQNPPAVVNIGSGLVSLSLTFLSPPTIGTTYNLIQITSGGSGIAGYFAGLQNSGDTFSASYLGTPYLFSVNYSTNLYSLTVAPIPEPSTWALLGFGVIVLAVVRRRARR